jgi:hypothetical protein
MRWSHIGKFKQQIAVGPYFVFRHPSVCEHANESIERIVGECPAIVGKSRRARWVIEQNVWQQCPRHALRLGRRISSRVLQRVREASKETPIVCRFTSEVGISFFDKDDRLRRPGSALHLNPAAAII